MKTIEEYEAELESKISQCIDGMKVFEENLDNLGLIIKKDPKYIYNLLNKKLNDLIEEYHGTTLRNETIFNVWLEKAALILQVLDEVRANINNAVEANTIEDTTSVNQISEWFDNLANNAESLFNQSAIAVQEKTGFNLDLIKAAMIGAGGYIILRKIGLGQFESILIAGSIAYVFGKKQVQVVEIEETAAAQTEELPA